jgi:hypothetical protein
LWRTPELQDTENIHEQGTHGATDLRIAGSDDGIWEIALNGQDFEVTQSVFDEIVATVGQVAAELPNGGVREVVRSRLSDEALLREVPEASFWKL